ncbi:hypothetical protein EDD22DRAFT_959995 [Suillus occidentalis]|nr:hypothetical protein EDD22DRAFT_959995 [Suillus occidentalis]
MSLYDFDPHGHTGINWQGAVAVHAGLIIVSSGHLWLIAIHAGLVVVVIRCTQGLLQEQEGAFGGMQASSSYVGAQGMLQEQEGVFGGMQASSSYTGTQGSLSYNAEPKYDFLTNSGMCSIPFQNQKASPPIL